ncbi:MAG: DUF3810 domain-containing protein [Flavobacteriaceae bacterium]|nr:DUF3810 domain-containing protein [Flavobacteriaceae bacterium]
MKNEFKNYKPLIYAIIYAIVIWIGILFLSKSHYFVNNMYPSFYQKFYPIYAKLWGWIPVSVGDIFYIVLIILLIWTLILGVRCFVFGQTWRGIRIVSRLIFIISTFYIIFHLFWGFNYYKPNLKDDFNIVDIQLDELKFMADDLLNKSKELRDSIVEDKNGVFTFRRKQFYSSLPKSLQTSDLQLYYNQIPVSSEKKYSLFSYFMRYFGVAGYYNPFSGEAQITSGMPKTSIPFSMAHEQAHQMGYATEFEANFIGYLTCIQAKDKAMNYAGNYKALKYVLNEIYRYDTVFVRKKLEGFSDGMRRDRLAERAYHEKYSGTADLTFSAMNNLYLKANRQEDGIESYNRFVDLLVGYYRIETTDN